MSANKTLCLSQYLVLTIKMMTLSRIPYSDNDFLRVIDALGEGGARNVLSRNAIDFYNPQNKKLG